jgi:7-cyano-7-deazaguanine synthase
MSPTPEKKVVVLCSGGMDSVTALYAAFEDENKVLASLSFHYGSKHNDREIPFAKCLLGKSEL